MAETVLIHLLSQRLDVAGPVVVQLCVQILSSPHSLTPLPPSPAPAPVTDAHAMLAREAAYRALGIAPFEMAPHLNVLSILSTHVLPDIANNTPGYHPVRRRAVWFIGSFAESFAAVAPMAYSAIVSSLKDGDIVVALSALEALNKCNSPLPVLISSLPVVADDCSFEKAAVQPFLNDIVSALSALLFRARDTDSLLRIINVTSILIERSQAIVAPSSAH